MSRKTIQSEAAPKAIGPYSQAVRAGELVYLSGQTPIDPVTGNLVAGGIGEQTRRASQNLKAVLEAGGLRMEDVIKVNVYLTDMADFAEMNTAYQEQFSAPYPARTTMAVAGLPLGAKVEIEMVAFRQG